MSRLALFDEEPVVDDPIDLAARALWERDAKRGPFGLNVDEVWPRVRGEYRQQARVALEAVGASTA